MKRVLFRLSMPNRGSWNGKWSGADRNYILVRKLSKKILDRLNIVGRASWYYDFGDGWAANVSAYIMQAGERAPISAGFCGYDWMVDSIIDHGEIKTKVGGIKMREYLGDAVYADWNGHHIILTAEDGVRATDTIYLDPFMVTIFLNYIKRLDKVQRLKGNEVVPE